MHAEAARRVAREEAQRFAAEVKSREETRRLFAEERAREQASRKANEVEAKAKPSASVGADAEACPEPSRRVRPASGASVRPAEATTEPKPVLNPEAAPPHNFKHTEHLTTQQTAPARKPPTHATQAPKERKNAAHAVRHG
jgi:hypothetical protein